MFTETMLEEAVYTAPLTLLTLKDEALIAKANSYLPYSSAMEIECNRKDTFQLASFKNIPDIMDVNCDSGEQRFRIPNGIRGLICFYHICNELKNNSLLNPLAGTHFHVDCTDLTEKEETPSYLSNYGAYNQVYILLVENEEWIIEELETWDYKGSYNPKGIQCGSWVRANMLGTAEFRIGEMSFDYPVLIKRIIHCNDMVRRIKAGVQNIQERPFTSPNAQAIINYSKTVIYTLGNPLELLLNKFNSQLSSLIPKEEPIVPKLSTLELARLAIKDRLQKINPQN